MAQPVLSEKDVDDFIIVRAVAFANKIQRIMLRDVLARHDMPLLEWRILFSIARFGDCHLRHICRHTSLDPAHGSRAAAELDRKGLIRRYADPEDGRRKLMAMTADGRAMFDAIWPEAQQLIKQITNQMDKDDFLQFKGLLDRANAIAAPILEESLGNSRVPDAA